MNQIEKKHIFTTQDGWINLHPWAMLLNVLAVLAIFISYHCCLIDFETIKAAEKQQVAFQEV